jgi:ComF family protein
MPGRLLDRLLPPSCVLCGLADERSRLCGRCHAVLPWNDCCCLRCAASLDVPPPAATPCGSCQAEPPLYSRACAPLRYAFPVDAALKRLKFRRRLMLAPMFADMLLPVLRSELADCDRLVPVPLHRWRHALRGFNQADEICRPVARATGLPMLMNVSRRRATRPQTGLTATERRQNLRNAFRIHGEMSARYPLIVDDVLTTGSTCNELARALLEAGAERVGVLVVARASSAPGGQAAAGTSLNV